ncbi:MAG: DUF5916 domain-containing protein [Proteobacteria bacterium]|nr:DUF5916 domain-containing protein [Pseudomonadota bacterium]MDA0992624.1 DUF5916 domain-containing protein [Pseudomonadota bacterium]
MIPRLIPATAAAALSMIFCIDVSVAQMINSAGKHVDAFMVEEAPVLDGVLDDDAWAFATIIDDLHQVQPDEFGPPSEKSLIYVVYTKDALYLAARFFDKEPDKVSAMVLRQGDFSFGEDSFTIMIDPFHQGRSGYIFDLTANGVRNQALYENVTKENWAWRGIWHGETKLDDQGWIAEVEVPFKTLSFDPANETWGLNFARYIGRKSEHIGWVSSNRAQNPSVSGEVGSLSGMEQGIGLDVVPSVRIGESKNFEVGTSSDSTEPAVDIFYKLTPALTAALTLNTDFSGSGVDERQINLTRFGLFFPERRAFFLQDTDIFEFGRIGGGGNYNDRSTISQVEQESGRPFFSRRIGLSGSGETIDINAGGKLTGRVGGWDIGMLGIQQDEFQSLQSSDLFVARFARNVLEESSVGIILTDGDPDSNSHNSLVGIDFRYLNTRLSKGGVLEGGIWYQQSDTEGFNDKDAAFGVSLRLPNAVGFRGGVSYKELQENFYPALGFVNRVNVRDLTAEAGYTWYPQNSGFRQVFSGVDYQRIETIQGALQSQVVTFRALEIDNHYGDRLSFHYQLFDEYLDSPFEISDGITIPAGDYSFDQYCVNGESGEFRKVSVEAFYCGGDFYDGTISAPGASVVWRPNAHFKISAGFSPTEIELAGGSFTTRLVSLRADIAFTNTWYWENFAQYDNVSYGLGLNSILRWAPRAGREMVLVLNREFVDYTRDRSFTSVTGDIAFKFSYTFRF